MILNIKILALTILVLGVVFASVSDYKTLTISNKLTFFMLSCGISLAGIYYFYMNPAGFLGYLLSVVVVYLIVYLMWHLGLWAGGDVKLLTAIASLLCVDYLDILPNFHIGGYVFPYYGNAFFIPALSVIVNSVVSIIPLILFITLYEIIKNKSYLIKDLFKKDDLINLLSTLNTLGIIFIINYEIHIDNLIVNVLLLLLISYMINRLSKKFRYMTIIITPIIIMISISYNNIQNYLIESMILITAIVVKNIIKDGLLKEALSYEVKLDKLHESMIPSYNLIKKDDKYLFDKRSLKEKISDNKDCEYVITQKAHGLTDEDIGILKELNKKGLISDSIKIKRSVAFAPFILAGLIITLTIGNTYLLINEFIGVIL